MTHRGFVLSVVVVLLAGAALRGVWLRADPPVSSSLGGSIGGSVGGSVGIVWHDEGAWVHNARNKALDGAWRTDNWNPMFLAPVFTALEYASFRAFGVGLWQARMVPLISGLIAVFAIVAGLRACAGRRVALLGGALLATNYVFVMWNRAALMESTMTMFIAVGWAAYARAEEKPAWGWVAGAAAVFAFFTKASAAFFLAALALEAIIALRLDPPRRRASAFTLAGLAVAAGVIAAVFVLPHWSEYEFYNWQMTVLRKPDYGVRALMDRASGLPIAQGLFSRMWLLVLGGSIAIVGFAARWRAARPAERLLALWVLVGIVELVAHDSTNERRYVMFIPALAALTALLLGAVANRAMTSPADRGPASPGARLLTTGLILVLGYVAAGSLLRLLFLDDVLAGHFSLTVRLSATIALGMAVIAWWRWRNLAPWLTVPVVPAQAALAVVVLAIGFNLYEYAGWAVHHTDANYRASVALGALLPPGTLVQGKLANGLSLENRIRPLFIGNGFGNYEDRLRRDDARYILTYDLPRIGYESSDGSGLIQGILDHYPNRRVVATFEVEETSAPDRAVLFAK